MFFFSCREKEEENALNIESYTWRKKPLQSERASKRKRQRQHSTAQHSKQDADTFYLFFLPFFYYPYSGGKEES